MKDLLLLFIAAFALRIALLPLTAHLPNGTTDEGFWKHWMEHIDNFGVLHIFQTTSTDYVGYHWVLWLLTLVYDFGGHPYNPDSTALHLLVKVPSLVFDAVLIATVYWATAHLARRPDIPLSRSSGGGPGSAALLAAAVIAFQPAVLYDSAVWAQTDSAITAAMLGALVLAARNRPFAAGAVFALGVAVKPHPVIIVPLLALLLWRTGGPRAWLRASAAFVTVALAVLGPWLVTGEGRRIAGVYEVLFTKERERLSELAWNFWWVFDQRGDPRPGDAIWSWFPLTFSQAGLALSALAALLSLLYAWRRPGLTGTLVAAAYIAFAFYEFPIGSHERYLYPFLGLLLPVVVITRERHWVALYAAVSTTFLLNLFVVAPPRREWMDRWVYRDFGVAVSLVTTGLFFAFTAFLVRALFAPANHPASSVALQIGPPKPAPGGPSAPRSDPHTDPLRGAP